MRNALYQGIVTHSRIRPKKHEFRYEVCYFFFNLESPEKLITLPPFLSYKASNYLQADNIRSYVQEQIGKDKTKKIKDVYILTQLSYFGFCFNPVSFYYCYGETGHLDYIVSHITNTPWGEKHLDCFAFQAGHEEFHFPKNFHVSPFMPMEINYTWKFSDPGQDLKIVMKNQLQDETSFFFVASMDLRAKEQNMKNVALSLVNYPMMSFKTILGIYWNALKLYLKKIPFYTHPKKREAI